MVSLDMGDIRPDFSKSPRNVPRNERFCPLFPTSDGVIQLITQRDPAETRAVKATLGKRE